MGTTHIEVQQRNIVRSEGVNAYMEAEQLSGCLRRLVCKRTGLTIRVGHNTTARLMVNAITANVELGRPLVIEVLRVCVCGVAIHAVVHDIL